MSDMPLSRSPRSHREPIHWSPRRALVVIVGMMVALWIGVAGMLDLLPFGNFFS